MGQTTLVVLQQFGAAVARAVTWLQDPSARRIAEVLVEHLDSAAAESAPGDAVEAPPAPWMRPSGWDVVDLHGNWKGWYVLPEEFARLDSGLWCIEATITRADESPVATARLLVEFSAMPHPHLGGAFRAQLGWGQYSGGPRVLAGGHPWWTRSRFRRLLQYGERLQPYPRVAIDVARAPAYNAESAQAQAIEGWLRHHKRDEPQKGQADEPLAVWPEMGSDAVAWWERWAKRVGRVVPNADLGPSDLQEVAARTLSPDSPVGHRVYWSKSLRRRWLPAGLVQRAAARAGMARSTAYDRLAKAARTADEFRELSDPEGELVAFLKATDRSNRIPSDEAKMLGALKEAGMTDNSARKALRRTRALTPEERARRVLASLEKARSRHRN